MRFTVGDIVRYFFSIVLAFAFCIPTAFALEPCQQIHGRARIYTADGQLRIWHIGTHHEFEPIDTTSWDKLSKILLPDGLSGTAYDLYADFTVCPTAPFKEGQVQPVIVKNIRHMHVVKVP